MLSQPRSTQANIAAGVFADPDPNLETRLRSASSQALGMPNATTVPLSEPASLKADDNHNGQPPTPHVVEEAALPRSIPPSPIRGSSFGEEPAIEGRRALAGAATCADSEEEPEAAASVASPLPSLEHRPDASEASASGMILSCNLAFAMLELLSLLVMGQHCFPLGHTSACMYTNQASCVFINCSRD